MEIPEIKQLCPLPHGWRAVYLWLDGTAEGEMHLNYLERPCPVVALLKYESGETEAKFYVYDDEGTTLDEPESGECFNTDFLGMLEPGQKREDFYSDESWLVKNAVKKIERNALKK